MSYSLTDLGLRSAWRDALADASFETGMPASHDTCLRAALDLLASRHGEKAVSDLSESGLLPKRLRDRAKRRDAWINTLSKAVRSSDSLSLPRNAEQALGLVVSIHKERAGV